MCTGTRGTSWNSIICPCRAPSATVRWGTSTAPTTCTFRRSTSLTCASNSAKLPAQRTWPARTRQVSDVIRTSHCSTSFPCDLRHKRAPLYGRILGNIKRVTLEIKCFHSQVFATDSSIVKFCVDFVVTVRQSLGMLDFFLLSPYYGKIPLLLWSQHCRRILLLVQPFAYKS